MACGDRVFFLLGILLLSLLCSLLFGLSSSPNSCRGYQNENDKVWCEIALPRDSHFGFSPPDDLKLWRKAKTIAASGEPVLAKHIQEVFNHPNDFIDGDKSFKNIENLVDYFLDPNKMFSPIAKGFISTRYQRKRAQSLKRNKRGEVPVLDLVHDPTTDPSHQLNLNYSTRAPIIHIGYFITTSTGRRVVSVSREDFLEEFLMAERKITTPCVFIFAMNENWGWLSTTFPNRTQQWGRYPNTPLEKSLISKLLDSDKVVMLVVNQHLNISHPKILVLPRGIPPGTNSILWDALRHLTKKETKSTLLVSYASNWGPRELDSVRSFLSSLFVQVLRSFAASPTNFLPLTS
jgi:hypothetical protein